MATEYSVSILLKLIDRLSNPLNQVSQKMMNLSERMQKIGKKMQDVGKKMSLFVTAPLALLGKQSIQTAGEFEKNRIAFESMLGSADKAKKLLEDLVEFSASTPFQLPGLIEGSKQLLAFGIPAEEITDKLRNLGNIAQGDQTKLSGLVQAFGKIRAKGVASMRELNMMINAGVPIMRALSEEFGVAEEEIFEMSRTGQLSYERIDQAITNLTTGTGMFAGILEKQSQSLSGLWSTLLDNLNLLGKEIAETFMPAMKGIINFVMGIVKWFRELDASTKKIIGTVLLLIAAIGPLLAIGGKLIALFAVGLGPVGLIVAGFVALLAVITAVTVAIDRHNNRFTRATKEHKKQREETTKLADEYEMLQKKTNRTSEEQERYLILQRELKIAIGDNALVLNEMTGELELNRKEFEKWTTEMRVLEVKNLQKELSRLNKKLDEQAKKTDWARKKLEEARTSATAMYSPEVYESYLRDYLNAERTIRDQIDSTEKLIEEYMKALVVTDEFAEGETKVEENAKKVNKELKTMAELLEEIDQATKQKIVGELLKGKEIRAFRTIDVIKRFEQMKKEDTKTKVDVSVKVEAEEGTSAKISKIDKTGDDANVSVSTDSYIGMHQYVM